MVKYRHISKKRLMIIALCFHKGVLYVSISCLKSDGVVKSPIYFVVAIFHPLGILYVCRRE